MLLWSCKGLIDGMHPKTCVCVCVCVCGHMFVCVCLYKYNNYIILRLCVHKNKCQHFKNILEIDL